MRVLMVVNNDTVIWVMTLCSLSCGYGRSAGGC
jgi:hypothetical protein